MELGFFVDIMGVGALLLSSGSAEQKYKLETRVIELISLLGNDLWHLENFASKNNIARFLIHQMGDGFMVKFDTVKFLEEPCLGKSQDMIFMAAALMYRYLVVHNGLLEIGAATGNMFGMSDNFFNFTKPENKNDENSWHCGQGVVYLHPISGTLLAKAYGLLKRKELYKQTLCINEKTKSPVFFIDSDLKNSVPDDIQRYFMHLKDSKEEKWYFDFKLFDRRDIQELYTKIWPDDHKDITFNSWRDILNKYNQKLVNI